MLEEFLSLLCGRFNNAAQAAEQQALDPNFPLAAHCNTACNDKIAHLPAGFAGVFVVEESTYTANGKTHASPHLFLFTEEGDGIRLTSYEIPAGVAEPSDETMLAAAQRELLEETGYGGGQWRLLTTLCANPATQNNLTHCFLATGVERLGAQRPDPTEDIRVHLLSRDEVLELLRTDRIRQALMAAPLWRWFAEEGIVG